MTYKIEPGLGRITSPITLLFPDGAKKEYKGGKELCETAFNRKYRVVEMRAVENAVEIKLEPMTTPIINPVGEETFF